MHHKTLILGAGAAGMMAAVHAGAGTLVLDHAKRAGEKIRISGGGRCNFTNLDVTAANYISENKHFAKSALARYSQWDFIELVSNHGIAWHEKTLGQLFCDDKATQIIDMLLAEMTRAGAQLRLGVTIGEVSHDGRRFVVETSEGRRTSDNLVLATGGKSIPKMGATGLAYEVAQSFGHEIVETRPALVPLTFGDRFADLAGLSLPVTASNDRARFSEGMLFTHRGLSGPAILQISSYWCPGEEVVLDLAPEGLLADLRAQRQARGGHALAKEVSRHLPARLVAFLAADLGLAGNLADQSDARLGELVEALANWRVMPTGSEGYRTAEVTAGGVSTDALSSQSMESVHQPGLFVIGEAVDVTGWLGGYNFQWAWASGAAAGRHIATLG